MAAMKPMAKMLAAGVVLVGVVAACGNNDEEDGLTKDEATGLLSAIAPVLMSDTVTPIHLSEDSIVIACPEGGRARVGTRKYTNGWVADTFRIDMDFSVTPNECEIESGRLPFTLGGDPALGWRTTIDVIGRDSLIGLAATGSADGGVSWRIGPARSGRCPIDLTLVAEADLSDRRNPKLNAAYRGRFCDHDVDVDIGEVVF